MKEKIAKTVRQLKNPAFWLVLLFLAVLVVPAIVWDEMSPEFRSKKLLWENRAVRNKPLFTLRKIQRYPRDFNEYYSDAFPFREYLVWSSRKFTGPVTNYFSTKAFIGKDGYFFYTDSTSSHGDESRDFTGKNLWTRSQLKLLVKQMEHTRRELKKLGVDFYVLIAPNKMTVYYDKLPEKRRYRKAELTRAQAIVAAIREHAPELKICFADEVLKDARTKVPHPLFLHEDTHWNELAAYAAFRELISMIPDSVKLPPLEKAKIVQGETRTGGDLRTVLGGGEPGVYEYMKVYVSPTQINITEHPDFHHKKSFNPTAPDKRKVWIFRDSFADAMEPYIAATFRSVDYFWGVPIRRIQFMRKKDRPDIVIFEAVERSLGSLDEFDFETKHKAKLEYFR